MLKRYHITCGASTTAGGKVVTAGSVLAIDGAKIAPEGDKISCSACGTDGVIQADGRRLGERFNTLHVALSDDLCICRCSPPPRLVAIQTTKYQMIDTDPADALNLAAAYRTPPPGQRSPSPAGADNALAIRLLHPESREPLGMRHYKLELAGRTVEGTTDADGCTQPLSAAERASLVAWHVDDMSAS